MERQFSVEVAQFLKVPQIPDPKAMDSLNRIGVIWEMEIFTGTKQTLYIYHTEL